MKISIGSDHAGFAYKQLIIEHLRGKGHEVLDCGTHSAEATDYPLFIIPAAEAVTKGEAERGIVLGGSGNGEAIAANKVHGVRCGLVWCNQTAELCRRHNDANVISIGERMTSIEIAIELVDIFLATPFEGGRHQHRIDELSHYEQTGELRKE
ncbi:MAG: ribose-5-phosphate isomerase [Terrimicrobiaceae bacterium]|nr:ribose-5-phosphate isomerase [Terrimicrobiaceae bacterium]